ncbi:melanopsin-like [Liolophura sinensis]|uniref:melanopsin-like n=1 Tax=Liolophura sinensis TaxID=3198878 RepID=UPI0031598ECA
MASSENETFFEEGGEGPQGLPSISDMHTLIGMQSILLLVGVTGNSLVLYVFGNRGERLTYVIAILSLAVIDLISCCLYLPFAIALEAQWFATSSNFVCKCFHFFTNVTHCFSTPSLLLIALDRCACVCVGHVQATYHRRAFIAIVVVGVYSLSVSIFPTLAYRVNNGYCTSDGTTISEESIILFHNFIVAIFMIVGVVSILIYSAIFGVVLYLKYGSKQHVLDSTLEETSHRPNSDTESSLSNAGDSTTPDASANTADKGRQLADFQQEQISIAVVMFTLTFVYFTAHIPLLLGFFKHAKNLGIVLSMMYEITFVSNFFVYLCLDAPFRKEVKELFQSTWSRLRSLR